MATPTTLPAAFVSGAVLQAAQLNDLRGAFRILQVVSTTKSDTFTSASTAFVDVTGLSVSITPSATSSKVLVYVEYSGCNDVGVSNHFFQVLRDATAIAVGDVEGSRTPVSGTINLASAASMANRVVVFLDSPATTSATTYKVQARNTGAGTLYINRAQTDTNAATTARGISTITVFEVSA
jgi:hypothetical protein